MADNKTYTFVRPESEKYPPRFTRVAESLEEAGVYNSQLRHPNADWNRIELTVFDEGINLPGMIKVLRELGYLLNN